MVASAQIAEGDQAQLPTAVPDRSCNLHYQPITGQQRFKWFAQSTIGPQSLAAGVFSAAFGTATNSPKEYRGTWEGFAKRYGMLLRCQSFQ